MLFGGLMMEDIKLKEAVKSIMDSIFSEKEEADRQRMTEEALTKSTATIDSLTSALSAKKDECKDLEDKYTTTMASIEELEAKIAEYEATAAQLVTVTEELNSVKAKLETVTADHEAVVAELATAKASLDEIESLKVAEVRYEELKEASLAYKDKDKQVAKIKGMTEEEYASYKSELLDIKELLAGKEESSTPPATAPLANVDKTTASIAMVVEDAPESLVSKYSKLGSALASMVSKETNELKK